MDWAAWLIACKLEPHSRLTVVAGRWAFCAFDAKGDGHDWRETEGVTIEALRFGLPKSRFAQLPAEDRSR